MSIEHFHLRSQQPCWCTLNKKNFDSFFCLEHQNGRYFYCLLCLLGLRENTLLKCDLCKLFQEPFRSFGKSVVKTTVMTIGEFDYTNMLIDGLGQSNTYNRIRVPLVPFPRISNAFFFIFMLTMPIVLMNLLVRTTFCNHRGGLGLISSTYLNPVLLQIL